MQRLYEVAIPSEKSVTVGFPRFFLSYPEWAGLLDESALGLVSDGLFESTAKRVDLKGLPSMQMPVLHRAITSLIQSNSNALLDELVTILATLPETRESAGLTPPQQLKVLLRIAERLNAKDYLEPAYRLELFVRTHAFCAAEQYGIRG